MNIASSSPDLNCSLSKGIRPREGRDKEGVEGNPQAKVHDVGRKVGSDGGEISLHRWTMPALSKGGAELSRGKGGTQEVTVNAADKRGT